MIKLAIEKKELKEYYDNAKVDFNTLLDYNKKVQEANSCLDGPVFQLGDDA